MNSFLWAWHLKVAVLNGGSVLYRKISGFNLGIVINQK